MKVFRKSFKPISLLLALTFLLSGIVLPQTFPASGETAAETSGTVYPADVLSEANFSNYFTVLGTGTSVAYQSDGSVLITAGASAAKGYGVVSKAPVSSENYTISFDLKPSINSEGRGSSLVCFKSNRDITEFLGTLWNVPANTNTANVFWKPASADAAVGQSGVVADENGATAITYSDWIHVTYTITPAKAIMTTTTEAGVQIRTIDYTCTSGETPYSFKDADGNCTLDNYIAFMAQNKAHSYYIKNLQVTDDAPTGAQVYPSNVTQKGVFEQYFTALSGSYTHQTDGSVLLKIDSGKGKGIVSKSPVDADEYFVAFDMKPYDETDPIVSFKTDSDLSTDMMGVLWSVTTDATSGKHYAMPLDKYIVNGGILNQYNYGKYVERPTDSDGNNDWMHVLVHVTDTDATVTYETAASTYSYTVNYAARGFAANALSNYIGFMGNNTATQYYINNLQVTKANPTGLFQDDVFEDTYKFNTAFQETTAGSTSLNNGVATYSGATTSVISRLPAGQSSYTISCDVKHGFGLDSVGNGPFIIVKSDSDGKSNSIGFRFHSDANNDRLFVNWDNSATTDYGNQKVVYTEAERTAEWIHIVAEVTDTSCTVTWTYSTGKSYTGTIDFTSLTDLTCDVSALQNYVGFRGAGTGYDIKNFQVTAPQTVEADAASHKNGYAFAGYYEDGDLTVPLAANSTATKAYAKYVDPDILSVKAQTRSGQDKSGQELGNAIRFITTVDTLNYTLVGFKITANGQTVEKSTTTVYESLYAGGTMTDPEIFSEDSAYFAAYTLKNMPDTALNTEITVQPFWETMDGTKVYGTVKTYCHSSLPLAGN